MDYKDTILSDPVNRWIFSRPEKDVYLVGGYIRDMLRGVVSTDKDFVIKGNVEKVAKEAAAEFKGTFIVLKKDQTYRVALTNRIFLDFTRLDAAIDNDLSERDYTLNALAWSPVTGIIDCYEGIDDIKKKKIRAIKAENIVADPLRILRAYRLSAQLGFTIERNTRFILKKYAGQAGKTSSERVTDELYKILKCNISHEYFKLCQLDKVLHEVLDLSHTLLSQNIDLIKKFERSLNKLVLSRQNNLTKSRVLPYLKVPVSQTLNGDELIKLSLLLRGAQLNSDDMPLKISNIIQKRVESLNAALHLTVGRITGSRLYEILKSSEGCEHEAMIMISLIYNKNVDKYLRSADEYLKIRRQPALSGDEIMSMVNISPGRRLGEIKEEIQMRQFTGNIRNRAEARQWIIANLT